MGVVVVRAMLKAILPMLEGVIAGSDSVDPFRGVSPHEVVFIRFLGNRDLLYEVSFKGVENFINDPRVPVLGRLMLYEFTYFGNLIVSFWGQNFIPILMWNPVISPNVNFVSCSYIPAATFIDNPNSIMNASPCIARVYANLRV
jgi:hypothetical protein